ncbi:ABC transporter permease [Pseudonocardia sp. CA-107938]|uniref:ABC transporter permease n=1 Tax=Pseudonocardia sp. CA-107938 TaxID=3240021 RepID=UPI003D8CEEB4
MTREGRSELAPPRGGPTPSEPAAPTPPDARYRGLKLALLALRAGPVAILLLLVVVLAVLSDVFLTLENIGNLLNQSAVVCVLALGQLLVIVTRGIDLSVGSNLSLCAVVGALVWRSQGSALVAVLAALATGSLVGLVNGLLYVKGRLPHPFIATLAMLTAASGLALYLSGSRTIRGAPPVVKEIGAGRIAAIPGGGAIGWFPTAALVVVGVAAVVALVLRGMVWGRWIYAVGGGPEAAVRNGIPVPAVLISVYVVCGFLAGVAALLTMGRGDAGSPTSGAFAELDAIAAVIIGGASFLGGRGSVLNALTGALVIAVMRNGLNLLGIDPNWQYMAAGFVIVVAVELDVLRGHLERRFRSLQAVGAR